MLNTLKPPTKDARMDLPERKPRRHSRMTRAGKAEGQMLSALKPLSLTETVLQERREVRC